jgi:hypothetical protein
MLFRLRMPIDQAISAYVKLASHVFSKTKWAHQEGTFKASRLEEAIVEVIGTALKIKRDEAIKTRMLNEQFTDAAKG